VRIRNPAFSQWCGSMTFLGGFMPLTKASGFGSGSSRPKNMWIRWVRIRIHNTAFSRIRSETKINDLDPDSVELPKNFNAELKSTFLRIMVIIKFYQSLPPRHHVFLLLQEMSQSCEACYTGTSRTTLCNLWLLLCQQVFSQCSRTLFYQSFSQCCVTGTVGTVTFCLVEPEP
jgi:hypothetical protein